MKPRRVPWLLLPLIAACGGSSEPSCPVVATDIALPGDEAPHQFAQEWWYYTGHLTTQDDRRYGFEMTIFQVFVNEAPNYPAHFAVTDLQKLEHFYDQKIEGHDAVFPSFDLAVGGWSIKGDGQQDQLQAAMAAGYALDLTCQPTKAAALHNGTGVIDMGNDSWSYYYSKTRMAATGTLQVDGVDLPVTGTVWSDHQWGDFDIFKAAGWDWFSFQLDDQSEIMIFLLRLRDGTTSLTGGTHVDPAGCATSFAQFDLEPTGSWQSPVTGATYPLGWTIAIPGHGLTLQVEPTVQAQELDARMTTLNQYWEGEVSVTGARDGKPVTGLGYVELTGYGAWGAGG